MLNNNKLNRDQMNKIKTQFVSAIARQSLGETARELLPTASPEEEVEIKAALRACQAISDEMRAVQDAALSQLAEANVQANPLKGALEKGDLQFHGTNIEIDRSDLQAALEALKNIGFSTPIPMTPARIRAFSSQGKHLQLIRFDAQTTRIILHFSTPPRTKIPSKFRPGIPDLATLKLPEPLWPLYFLTKPIRILHEKITRKRSPHHEIDFLGTPNGLITPILDCLNLTPENVLLDLGCGDGRICITASENYGCRSIGIEHNEELVSEANRKRKSSSAADLIEIRQTSAAHADLSEASHIFMFLPRAVSASLMPSVETRTSKGAQLILHEQSDPKSQFAYDHSIPIYRPEGITVVRIKTNP